MKIEVTKQDIEQCCSDNFFFFLYHMSKGTFRISGTFCKPGPFQVVSCPSVLNSSLCSRGHDAGLLPEPTLYSVTLPGCY